MEQERSTFRGILESHAGKCFDLFGQFCCIFCTPVLTIFLFVFCRNFVAEKEALEKRVKELEESLASKHTEAEKVAKDAAAREAEFVNRAAFLTQNVRGKIFLSTLSVYSNVCIGLCLLLFLLFCLLFRSSTPPSTCGFVEWKDVTRRSYERAGRVHCSGS